MEGQNKEKAKKTKLRRNVVFTLYLVILIQVLALGLFVWYSGNDKNETVSAEQGTNDFRDEANYWKKLNVK